MKRRVITDKQLKILEENMSNWSLNYYYEFNDNPKCLLIDVTGDYRYQDEIPNEYVLKLALLYIYFYNREEHKETYEKLKDIIDEEDILDIELDLMDSINGFYWYDLYESDLRRVLNRKLDEGEELLKDLDIHSKEDIEEFVSLFIAEYTEIDYEGYIKQIIKNKFFHINITFATDDELNYDLSMLNVNDIFETEDYENFSICDYYKETLYGKDMFSFILETQGLTAEDLLTKDTKVVNSFLNELSNSNTSYGNVFTLIAETRAIDLIDLLIKREGIIEIGRSETFGIFNFYEGSGSMFFEPYKTIKIPTKFIYRIFMEDGKFPEIITDNFYTSDNHSFTVYDVFGFEKNMYKYLSVYFK